ncbi:RNA-directed DNA polymerase, eukaryota, reverse transcriptase zinc-binding domain protein, partial [Tanacetum coccineum]
MFNGIKLSSSLSISHLFYADDAVFMGQWCDGNISTLIHVLECFYRASGLRINMSKSKILGVNVDSDKVKGAASKLGCLILKTPFTYLGSKVGGSMSRVHAWNEVIDRVKNRLSKWKMKTLSIGGRLTLLKSVLGSIPIFHMSIYRAPLSVLRTLESIRSKFFKGHDINSNKASWVNWKKVLASKEKGGLGVSSLFALNRGLMFKWIWRFYTQNTLLWVRVVKAIHGDDGNVGGHVKSGAKSCWLDIVRETHALKTKGINLLDCMHVKLGNGDKTVFWEDIWIDGKTLKNRFPRIYSLESCKLITVGAKLAQPSLEYSFRRNPRGGVEQDQFNELSALVHDVSLIPMSDRWKWDLESSGDFSVASVRKIIDDKSLSDVDSKTRWIKYVPIKVNVHAWKVKTDSLPTRFNVSRRGIDIDSIMCAICDNGVETSRHLFFYCCMVRQIVRKITRWWDVPYVEVESYEDWYNWLVNLRISSMHKQMFEGIDKLVSRLEEKNQSLEVGSCMDAVVLPLQASLPPEMPASWHDPAISGRPGHIRPRPGHIRSRHGETQPYPARLGCCPGLDYKRRTYVIESLNYISEYMFTIKLFLKMSGKEESFSQDYNEEMRKPRDFSKVKCYNYNEYGHYASHCHKRDQRQQRREASNLVEEELEPTLLMASTSFNKTQRKSSKDTPTYESIRFSKDYDDKDSKFGESLLEEDKATIKIREENVDIILTLLLCFISNEQTSAMALLELGVLDYIVKPYPSVSGECGIKHVTRNRRSYIDQCIHHILTDREFHKNNQYILATQATQVFYLQDLARQPRGWKVVEHVYHRDVAESDQDVIHGISSSHVTMSVGLTCLEHTDLSINAQSTEVDAPPVNDDNANANEDNADFINNEDDVVAHVLDDDVVVSDDDEVNP